MSCSRRKYESKGANQLSTQIMSSNTFEKQLINMLLGKKNPQANVSQTVAGKRLPINSSVLKGVKAEINCIDFEKNTYFKYVSKEYIRYIKPRGTDNKKHVDAATVILYNSVAENYFFERSNCVKKDFIYGVYFCFSNGIGVMWATIFG